MLKLVDIKKDYALEKESVTALNNVSIEFRSNEFVSILGPSGCGKTTLLNIIGGLDRYTSGDIQIEGISTKEYDDVDWDTYRNRRVGFVFQSYNLIPHMNILKNVALSLTLAGVSKEERTARAMEALRKVGLASQARKKPNQMSGGQMQRVAIARALVNNPEIILADEPTGALDSESGIQVMDLLKEVAQDRLVIMVTHNPSLAEEYSTRIVYLKDGEIVGDTMPYSSSEDVQHSDEYCEQTISPDQFDNADINQVDDVVDNSENQEVLSEDCQTQVVADTQANGVNKQSKCKVAIEKFKVKIQKLKNAEKTAMKLSTAISLSWNNLLAKKGRTLLTSIAGSIGIIGIVLVLSLSTGATNYISTLEESALSTYPLTVSQTNTDLTSILSLLTTPTEEEAERKQNPNTDEIFTSKLLGKVIDNLDALMATNDLTKFKQYIDENFDDSLATVKYNYGVNFNAYIQDPKNVERYMKVNPYTEVMGSVLDNLPDNIKNMSVGGMGVNQMLSMFTSGSSSMTSSWSEMSSNQKLLESQYELVGSQSRWPSSATDVVIVVDSKNQLLDYQLFMLGLTSQDDVLQALINSDWAEQQTSVEDLLNLKYYILSDADYLEPDLDENTGDFLGTWTAHDHAEQEKTWIDTQDPIQINVCGVIRPKAGASVTSISGVIGYTHELTEMIIERAKAHPAVAAMLNRMQIAIDNEKSSYTSCINYSYATDNGQQKQYVANSSTIAVNSEEHKNLMRKFGVANLAEPTSIEFYCTSFESKDQIIQFINQYNKDMNDEYLRKKAEYDAWKQHIDETGEIPEEEFVEPKEFSDLRYGDSLAVMMGFVNTMSSTITGVLVAFAAISLIVSTIMIAIIIYTSVLERRKEIGVLRSIGARKKDVSRVFIAESAILGAYSGIIGILVSSILALIGSAILKLVFEIEGLMHITWWHCLMMFLISVLLSMFAGFIPSRIAANKDPAIALRSE